MVWSHNQFGQLWKWDPREIGALCVLAWSGVLLQSLRSRAASGPSPMPIAVMGNIIVCVSGFGPNLLAGANGRYAVSVPGKIVAAFLFAQFVAIYMSLLPAGFLRLERLGRKS
jgi:hypothetical protein